MPHLTRRTALAALSGAGCALLPCTARAQGADDRLRQTVEQAARAIMAEHDVPGLAVGVTRGGQSRFFSFGIASRESRQPVSERTIFEIGSISKTFTAVAGGLGQARGSLSFAERAGRHWPALDGTPVADVPLLDLGTYTAGGFPLQFPSGVGSDQQVLAYFRGWRPSFPAGARRQYSNPSIGLFGHLAARAMGKPFADIVERDIFPAFGMASSHVRVPRNAMASYAHGYSRDNRPIRVGPGPFAAEAYGVKTTAADMIRFVEANIDSAALSEEFRRAVAATQSGYYQVGPMLQGLGWEMYADPADLSRLQDGNSRRMTFEPNEAARVAPASPPNGNMLFNKTGSTNGFGAYAAFVPTRRIGVVLLANRSYSNPARIDAGHRILMALGG